MSKSRMTPVHRNVGVASSHPCRCPDCRTTSQLEIESRNLTRMAPVHGGWGREGMREPTWVGGKRLRAGAGVGGAGGADPPPPVPLVPAAPSPVRRPRPPRPRSRSFSGEPLPRAGPQRARSRARAAHSRPRVHMAAPSAMSLPGEHGGRPRSPGRGGGGRARAGARARQGGPRRAAMQECACAVCHCRIHASSQGATHAVAVLTGAPSAGAPVGVPASFDPSRALAWATDTAGACGTPHRQRARPCLGLNNGRGGGVLRGAHQAQAGDRQCLQHAGRPHSE